MNGGRVRDAHRPEPKCRSSTGELIDIERVTISSEGDRWKSTRWGNSLAVYPTSRPVLRRGGESNLASLAGDQRQHGEHRLHQYTVLPRAARTQFEVGGIARGRMEGAITQDNHLVFELPTESLKGVIRHV